MALAVLLFFPLRKIIWVMTVRRAQRKGDANNEGEQRRLYRRSGVTAALLSFLFSLAYGNYFFGSGP
ncbi:MAG: hypothetical protein HN478_12725 [Rhodospirillaceae bacterium]|nr:hypothetical protein [Rhodospirillaceae bacterium]MBT4489998.1 hypothetical protein [Rhodospirillaceae bacterium]MBT5191366.1 hypothetical protein [Rhodospirillaceae bacterium]MBT6426862.1 hypothetical protein [Rhodospirillaceae bacterium]MBT7757909.1 hypothetical protein [Rhodospirillaceae bacterium]